MGGKKPKNPKKPTQLESALFERTGSVLDPASLAVTWHGGGKAGAVLLYHNSALPARQKKIIRGGKENTRLELARLERVGSVRDLARLAVIWHGEGENWCCPASRLCSAM